AKRRKPPGWSRPLLVRVENGGGLHIGGEILNQRPKGLVEGVQGFRDPADIFGGDIGSGGFGDQAPVCHGCSYDSGSAVSWRAVQCAPARTTRAATKLHRRMVTEYSKILYSRSSFSWSTLVKSMLTYFRPSRIRPTTMATGATRAGSTF